MSDGTVFDHHALILLGSGNRQLSGDVHAAHADPLYTVMVPALCLAEAVRHRPGIAPHLAHLPAVEVSALDRITAELAGRIATALFPDGGWPVIHAVAASMTTGWEISTGEPDAYKGFGVPLMPVRPN